MKLDLGRRWFAFGALALATHPAIARGADPLDLNWTDLRPRVSQGYANPSQAVSHFSAPSRRFSDPRAFAVVKKYKGQRIRLPGFLIPLNLGGGGATEFLLVPFVGACIHVPPPPPNQIVYATTQTPFEMTSLFAPVFAIGTLDTVYAETGLAQASYTLAVETFEPVNI